MDTPLEIAAEGVRRAILDEGPSPLYHARQIARLKKEWPTLYQALINLMAAQRPVNLTNVRGKTVAKKE